MPVGYIISQKGQEASRSSMYLSQGFRVQHTKPMSHTHIHTHTRGLLVDILKRIKMHKKKFIVIKYFILPFNILKVILIK